MLAIVTGADFDKAMKSLVEYATKVENYFRPEGKDPGFGMKHKRTVTLLDISKGAKEVRLQVIFSITEAHSITKTVLVRHATIAEDEEMPSASHILAVGLALGFTGHPNDWSPMKYPLRENAVAILQEYEPKVLS